MSRDDPLRDDRTLCDAFRRGERHALERVYVAYLPLVRTVCARGFGQFRGFHRVHERDDAIQTIFLAAFQERTRLSYDGLGSYSAFLRGIAQNTVRNMLEKKKRFDRRPEAPDRSSEDIEAQAIRGETVAVVRAFRASITDPREKAVIQRYFVDGLAEERLAPELGITRYRLRKTIKTLDKRLRTYLKKHGVDYP